MCSECHASVEVGGWRYVCLSTQIWALLDEGWMWGFGFYVVIGDLVQDLNSTS